METFSHTILAVRTDLVKNVGCSMQIKAKYAVCQKYPDVGLIRRKTPLGTAVCSRRFQTVHKTKKIKIWLMVWYCYM